MKVVLFCGGMGMRLREYSETIPKPMVTIGYRPILWHVMKYYAHYGHKDFILCLGHGADVIKNYFLNYNECLSNDFVLSQGGRSVHLLNSDIQDWKITFADTGATSNIGQRLKAVEKYLVGEDFFMANYSDGLTDLPLPKHIDYFHRQDRLATFLWVKPNVSFHFIAANGEGIVQHICDVKGSQVRINGGYFVFKKKIFHYIHDGEELLHEPFQRLVSERQLAAHEYDGFWAAMDTFKDKQLLDDMYARGNAPWEVWKQAVNGIAQHAPEPHRSAPNPSPNGHPRSARQDLTPA
jgi:glucose-1-phosphate cytidylyltransferase